MRACQNMRICAVAAAAAADDPPTQGPVSLIDVFLMALLLAGFAAVVAYVRLCSRVVGRETRAPEDFS